MSFDEIQKNFLKPIDKKDAVIYFPFFANTFPLAYHYYQLEHPKNVKPHDWKEEPIPKDLMEMIRKGDERPFIFYATEKTIKKFKRETAKFGKKVIVDSKFISEYIPRMFFFHTSRHTSLKSLVEENCGENKELTESFFENLQDRCDVIEIYTDIPSQAGILKKIFEKTLKEKRVNIIDKWEEYFNFPDPSERVIRVYFYGAPVTASLRKRPTEFTYVTFPAVEDKSELYTFICAGKVVKLNGADDKKKISRNIREEKNFLQEILGKLSSYHENLFAAASTENRFTDLRNVWWTYNRYALSQQHNSLFKSPKDFAEALAFHHNQEIPTNEV